MKRDLSTVVEVLAAASLNQSTGKIAKNTGVPKTTVRRILSQAKAAGVDLSAISSLTERLVFVPENDPSFLYDQETKKWLGEDIDELIPSMRAIEALKTGGIETVGQLVQLSARDLMKLPNFGRKCLKHTVEALAEQGLTLAPVRGYRFWIPEELGSGRHS